jgi:alcohol dehydrogenase (cytochrome c)
VLLATVLGLVLASSAFIVASPGVLVRLRVLSLAASGHIDGLGPRDAKRIFGRDANAWMRDVLGTHNAFASILNPYINASDAVVGADIFQQNCAPCHGAGAKGSHVAPALVGRTLATGNNDWSVFRTIQNGVPGTSMPPHAWSDEQIWQTVAYLRSAGLADGHGGGIIAAVDPRLESVGVSYDELAHAGDPAADWPMYSGSYSGSRHSKLAQITPANVGHLVAKWLYQFGGVTGKLETTPLVRNGVMFVSTPTSVLALDAQTGIQLWKFVRQLPEGTLPCCGLVNRGVALLGSSLFFGTADAHLLAISARTGRLLWDARVAEDYHDAYSITSAPLAFSDLVVVGISGGDYATRGYLVAYDAQTGK